MNKKVFIFIIGLFFSGSLFILISTRVVFASIINDFASACRDSKSYEVRFNVIPAEGPADTRIQVIADFRWTYYATGECVNTPIKFEVEYSYKGDSESLGDRGSDIIIGKVPREQWVTKVLTIGVRDLPGLDQELINGEKITFYFKVQRDAIGSADLFDTPLTKFFTLKVTSFLCAYIADNGKYACIPNSEDATDCRVVSGCVGVQCSKIVSAKCGYLAKAYACVAENDGRYACGPQNKSDCSDIVGCSGKPCVQIEPEQCGQFSGSGGSGSGGSGAGGSGTPTTTQYVFNLRNPIGADSFQDLVNIIGKWIFSLAIPIAVIVIIYAGIIMLTSWGTPAKFQKGAKALWYAVIGLAIVLIGKGFVTLIQSILSLRNE